MDQTTQSILLSLATNYFSGFTIPKIQQLFAEAFKKKPGLEKELQNAQSTLDFERVFREAVGVIDATAGSGAIAVDSVLLSALRGIKFDHQNGIVTIQGSTIIAPILQTGGKGVGQTIIASNTVLRSAGTSIHLGQGCSIKMSGNASIRQS